jgi:uncharacterized membrane protein YccC
VKVRDPGRIFLRKGIRAAVAMPIVVALTLYVADDPRGAIFAGFGTMGLLVNADYAGSWTRRLVSYLATGVAGAAVLLVGWAASSSVVAAVAVTFVVVFALSFIGLLRGMLAVGIPAVTLIYVVAVSIGGPPEAVPDYLLGWSIAVVCSTLIALFLLPHDVRQEVRDALSAAFARAADLAQAAWLDPLDLDRVADARRAYLASLVGVSQSYDGKPFRPTGASQRDRALMMLVAQSQSTGLILSEDVPATAGLPELDGRPALRRAVVDVLRSVSRAIVDPTVTVSALDLDRVRDHHAQATDRWVLAQAQAGAAPEEIAAVVQRDHILRIAALFTEQMVALTRQANGQADEDLAHEPPIPQIPWSAVMAAHLNWHSPWLRTALRTALGLALAVLIVQLTGVQHGFWVLLGVIAILRFDMAATRSMAVQAIAGTVLGVAIGTVVLLGVGERPVLVWVLLPGSVFLAAWAPGAVNFLLGQTAFSLFILILLGIVDWPPDLTTGLIRIEDIGIGAAVAIVVGVLLWPRGALGALHEEVARGLRASSAYLALTMQSLVEAIPIDDLHRARMAARAGAQRATETYDIAIMQRGAAAGDTTPWARLALATHTLISVGRIVTLFRKEPPTLGVQPALARAVDGARASSLDHWEAVAADVGRRTTGSAPHPPAPVPLDMPPATGISSEPDADAYVAAVYVLDWVDHLNRISNAPDVIGAR